MEIVERTGLPNNCPQDLIDWYNQRCEGKVERVQKRIEIYQNYYEVNNIKEKDEWKVNLRKQITFNNKL